MSTEPGTLFGTYVREKRLELGLTQRALAELTGVSIDLVRHVEQGGTNFQLAKLQQLVGALGGEVTVRDRLSPLPFAIPDDEDQAT